MTIKETLLSFAGIAALLTGITAVNAQTQQYDGSVRGTVSEDALINGQSPTYDDGRIEGNVPTYIVDDRDALGSPYSDYDPFTYDPELYNEGYDDDEYYEDDDVDVYMRGSGAYQDDSVYLGDDRDGAVIVNP